MFSGAELWESGGVALFKRKKSDARSRQWGWDPAVANVSGDQAWALLTNGIYFHATAPRMDTLGGGLEGLDWVEGLATWWDVRDEREFDELTTWMKDEGYRTRWAREGFHDGQAKYAWDFCRLITVSGGAALAQVISSDYAWAMVMSAADELSKRFDSWESLADNYLSGRILWLKDKGQWEPTPDPSQAHFQTIADELVADSTSPWNRTSWDRSAGTVIDGEPFE